VKLRSADVVQLNPDLPSLTHLAGDSRMLEPSPAHLLLSLKSPAFLLCRLTKF